MLISIMPMEKSLRSYFSAYQKRFPEKEVDQAVVASRRWITSFVRFILDDDVPTDLSRKIDDILDELRKEGMSDPQQKLL